MAFAEDADSLAEIFEAEALAEILDADAFEESFLAEEEVFAEVSF